MGREILTTQSMNAMIPQSLIGTGSRYNVGGVNQFERLRRALAWTRGQVEKLAILETARLDCS